MAHFIGADVLKVKYPKKHLTGVEGTSLKLTCYAEYNYAVCGRVEVAWFKSNVQNWAILSNPIRYLTTVNETIMEGPSRRQRQVETEILHLTHEDQDEFQCRAKCELSGDQAMGHIVEISVKGPSQEHLR